MCVKYTPTIAHMDIFTYPHGPVNECTRMTYANICTYMTSFTCVHTCQLFPGCTKPERRKEGRKEGRNLLG